MIIKFLGTHNAESKNSRLVTFLIDGVLAVDAGSLSSELTFQEQTRVKAILLSHGHYDHIRAVPALAFNNLDQVTRVLATPQTLQILSTHLVNGVVYPKFTSEASFLGKATLQLIPLEVYKPQVIDDYNVTAIPVRHPLNAVGFEIVSRDGKEIFYTGDTGPGLSQLWGNISPQLIIADVTWPNSMGSVAEDAGHLCPEMLKSELIEFHQIKGYLPKVSIIHLSPRFESEIGKEIRIVAEELGSLIEIAHQGEELIL